MRQAFINATGYWNSQTPPSAQITEGGSDITIIVRSSLPADTPAQNVHNNDGTGTIFWNPAFDGATPQQLYHLLAHEWGHTLGLQDQTLTCGQSDTVMYKPVNLNGSLIGSTVYADMCAAKTDYGNYQ